MSWAKDTLTFMISLCAQSEMHMDSEDVQESFALNLRLPRPGVTQVVLRIGGDSRASEFTEYAANVRAMRADGLGSYVKAVVLALVHRSLS